MWLRHPKCLLIVLALSASLIGCAPSLHAGDVEVQPSSSVPAQKEDSVGAQKLAAPVAAATKLDLADAARTSP